MARITTKGKRRCWIFDVYGDEKAEEAINALNDVFVKFCCIKHDRFTDEEGGEKTPHWHFFIDYGAPTTLKYMRETFGELAANGYIEGVIHPDHQYRYLYHDQKIEKAKGKYVYDEYKDIKRYNGFDPEELKGLTESERMAFMDAIMVLCKEKYIVEYSTLLEGLSQEDRTLYRFAINNALLICKYLSSARHRDKVKHDKEEEQKQKEWEQKVRDLEKEKSC